jgi:hypothetical protein
MEIPNFLSALCLPLASIAGYGPFVTSLTSCGTFTLINLICITDSVKVHCYTAACGCVVVCVETNSHDIVYWIHWHFSQC